MEYIFIPSGAPNSRHTDFDKNAVITYVPALRQGIADAVLDMFVIPDLVFVSLQC